MNNHETHLIEQQLISYLNQHSDVYEDFSAQTDLLAEGILDSLLVTDLVLFTQKHFGVALTARDISPENLSSIQRLAGLIHQKQQRVQRAA